MTRELEWIEYLGRQTGDPVGFALWMEIPNPSPPSGKVST